MKLDYKLPLKKMGGLPKRLLVHCTLVCVALLCISLAFHHKAPSIPSTSQQEPCLAESNKNELSLPQIAICEINLPNQTDNEASDKSNKDSDTNNISKGNPADGKNKTVNQPSADKNDSNKAEPSKTDKANRTDVSKTDPEKNWRVVTVKKGDTLAKIFKRYGYSKKDLHEILNANPKHQKQLTSLKTNQTLKLWLTSEKQVQGLAFDLPKGKTLHLVKKTSDSKVEDKLQNQNENKIQIASKANKLNKPAPEKQLVTTDKKLAQKTLEDKTTSPPKSETGLLQASFDLPSTQSVIEKSNAEKPAVGKQIVFGKGTIRDSLFSAAKRAGLDHNVVSQMVEIFGWNIDFSFDLRPNDSFRVLFEEKYQDGERISTGVVLAAEIINHGKVHRAIRYTDKSGRTGYFSPDGNGLRQAFLRYPVNFTRISSEFGQRRHPISHRMRHHKGIDYSAPAGTPVQAAGDAKVLFIGTRGGYGKAIELAHGARYSTLYAHLSRFSKNLKVGSEVKQGQIIGYVGATGAATGNHLHYEFRIDGIHRDPHTVDVPKRSFVPDTHKNHFLAHAREMLKLMDLHENKINMVRNEYPKNK